jgi:hypothetical protein
MGQHVHGEQHVHFLLLPLLARGQVAVADVDALHHVDLVEEGLLPLDPGLEVGVSFSRLLHVVEAVVEVGPPRLEGLHYGAVVHGVPVPKKWGEQVAVYRLQVRSVNKQVRVAEHVSKPRVPGRTPYMGMPSPENDKYRRGKFGGAGHASRKGVPSGWRMLGRARSQAAGRSEIAALRGRDNRSRESCRRRAVRKAGRARGDMGQFARPYRGGHGRPYPTPGAGYGLSLVVRGSERGCPSSEWGGVVARPARLV